MLINFISIIFMHISNKSLEKSLLFLILLGITFIRVVGKTVSMRVWEIINNKANSYRCSKKFSSVHRLRKLFHCWPQCLTLLLRNLYHYTIQQTLTLENLQMPQPDPQYIGLYHSISFARQHCVR